MKLEKSNKIPGIKITSQDVDIDKLRPATFNDSVNRTDKNKRVWLKRDIEKYGLLDPLKVTKNGEYFEIADGNTRFEICKDDLGFEKVKCLIYENLKSGFLFHHLNMHKKISVVNWLFAYLRGSKEIPPKLLLIFEDIHSICGKPILTELHKKGKSPKTINENMKIILQGFDEATKPIKKKIYDWLFDQIADFNLLEIKTFLNSISSDECVNMVNKNIKLTYELMEKSMGI